MNFTGNLNLDIAEVKRLLANDDTVVYRSFENKYTSNLKGIVIFTEILTGSALIDRHIISPLINSDLRKIRQLPYLIDTVCEKILEANEVKRIPDINEALSSLLIGDTLILLEGVPFACAANTKTYPARSVSMPETENAISGPKEAFCEVLVYNMGLLRRKVKNPKLKFKTLEVGKITKTRICLSYIEGLAEDALIKKIEDRLNQYEIDASLDSNYLAELLKDTPYTPFKTIGTTERPDVVAGKLLEGRVAILCDGSPFALTAPFLFMENFQTSEDYYTNFYFATFIRALRYLAFFLSISLPGLYIALIAFHKEMIPLTLLLSIVNSRDAVPFPAVLEMVMLLILFDLLREAGLRLPKPVGGTIGTVGGIVLGQSIVSARIVSAEMIIIVALCAITSFLTPKLDIEIILSRFFLLFLCATLGIYGYSIGLIILFVHMSSLNSFDVPFLSYQTAMKTQNAKDVYLRAPWWLMFRRPKAIQKKNVTRLRRKD
ncbi:MAG: spore germination protein [Clostridia bacterium]|nr:spore germination protein [Clostridia bacterium]